MSPGRQAATGAHLFVPVAQDCLSRFLKPVTELVGRILGPILYQLVSNGVAQIQSGGVGEAERIAQDIGQFFGESGAMRFDRRSLRGLGGVGPLKQLHELGRFDRDRHGEVLGSMKLLPVPLGNELCHQAAQFSNCGRGVGHGELVASFERDCLLSRLSSGNECQTGLGSHRQAAFVGGGGSDRQRMNLNPVNDLRKVQR